MAKKSEGGPIPPVIRFAPLGVIKTYEVQEHELEQLSGGSSASVFLSFALTLLSAGLTLLVTMFTVEFKSDRLHDTFWSFCLVFLINGTFLLVLWWRGHDSSRRLLEIIKARMPSPPGLQDSTEPSSPSPS